MTLNRWAFLGAAALMLVGCATPYGMPMPAGPPPAEPTAAYDSPATRSQVSSGHATIKGQAFSKTVGGDVKYGAGNTIWLIPATPYTEQCLELLRAHANTSCQDHLSVDGRSTVADGMGNFEFDNVGQGKYIVNTFINWSIPGPYGLRPTGGLVMGAVTIDSDAGVKTVYVQ